MRDADAIAAVFTPLFVALSPAFTLFVQPLRVGSQALPNGALDGILVLGIAHAPGNGDHVPARYTEDFGNLRRPLPLCEQGLDLGFLGNTLDHAAVSLRAIAFIGAQQARQLDRVAEQGKSRQPPA